MRPVPSLALLGALVLHALFLLGPWPVPDTPAPAPTLQVKALLSAAPASTPPPPSRPESQKSEPAAPAAAAAASEAPVLPASAPPAAPQEPASPPSVPASSGPAAAEPALEPELYLRLVREAVAGQKRYPYAARVRGQQGTAVVRFALDSSGGLLAPPRIARSSGTSRLDEAARAAVTAAAPFAPPPGFDASFDLPVEFVLNSSP